MLKLCTLHVAHKTDVPTLITHPHPALHMPMNSPSHKQACSHPGWKEGQGKGYGKDTTIHCYLGNLSHYAILPLKLTVLVNSQQVWREWRQHSASLCYRGTQSALAGHGCRWITASSLTLCVQTISETSLVSLVRAVSVTAQFCITLSIAPIVCLCLCLFLSFFFFSISVSQALSLQVLYLFFFLEVLSLSHFMCSFFSLSSSVLSSTVSFCISLSLCPPSLLPPSQVGCGGGSGSTSIVTLLWRDIPAVWRSSFICCTFHSSLV